MMHWVQTEQLPTQNQFSKEVENWSSKKSLETLYNQHSVKSQNETFSLLCLESQQSLDFDSGMNVLN